MVLRDLHERGTPAVPAGTESRPAAALLDQLELPLEVRLGRQVWSLERVLGLRVGDAVPVGPEGDDTVMLYVQNRPVAEGDLVVVDGRLAFRVRELVGGGAP
ncbi:MAG: FliM/FliN family flagellar motor C-terminal domain-containing protein [Acidobacteria bacterium]|jgi:flagellar motor switch/type III secretory pathway protein FliN|nr:FliM/FliN family flagellar motor C-terminal domain-containing protein [Acidobacteriota bacterium]MCU0255005.1 FliM/FliN family flagellar motor C-terminal domain-containing protein [Acidobacteriota bacterium]